MPSKKRSLEVPVDQLRWRLDPKDLPFETTDDIKPLEAIVGQKRGVEAFRFGMGMARKGYNIFVTGPAGTGRMATVKRMLKDLSKTDRVPDDLCYVNNFKRPEAPILLHFPAGQGGRFKKNVHAFLEAIKNEVPSLFESEEYIARKNGIAEAHERKVREFYKAVEDKVRDTGLVVVKMQMGPFSRPDLVPVVDGEPKRLVDIEEMVDNGRFPKEELERLKNKRDELKEELDTIFQEVRKLHKEVGKKHEEVDRLMFLALAQEHMRPLRTAHPDMKVHAWLDAMQDHMVDNLEDIKTLGGQAQQPQMPFMTGPDPEAVLRPYGVNLMVDNSERTGPPIIIESYPTYRNLFGAIERQVDRMGGVQTDFTRIKAGSFIKANGGYLVINLMDAIMEPGVWQSLKRSLKTEKIEIETYDPYYFFSGIGLKPEPIDMDVKVVVLGDPYLYHLLRHYDEDAPKVFKVRADWETSMDNDSGAVMQMAGFVSAETRREKLKPFTAQAVSALVEQAVRMSGRQEKLSTAFPLLSDLMCEADFYADQDAKDEVDGKHLDQAIESRIHRSNQIEERIQEMIDRGSLFVDTDGAVVGQVNGLAVYSMGDVMFGKPSRITAATSMGREGIINIEREADLSGPTHNKGMLILSGFLRRAFAQDKPLSLAASIAFEQSYGGVDGDSASSTELYALLSSLSGIPLRQDVAVTGSVNQKGEIQPIGGVNEKIEGFYLCCKNAGLTGRQGVMIPKANVKDLMLRLDVVEAVARGEFRVFAVETAAQGIEILTGKKAGTRTKSGGYTKNSVFAATDARLKELAEGLRDFGKDNDDSKKKTGGKMKGGKKPPAKK